MSTNISLHTNLNHKPSQIQQSDIMSDNPCNCSPSERLKNLEAGRKNLKDIRKEDDLKTILLKIQVILLCFCSYSC